MATKFENIYTSYSNIASEYKIKYNYDNMSATFGHIVMKMILGLTDDVYELNTNGYDDYRKKIGYHLFQECKPDLSNSHGFIYDIDNYFETFKIDLINAKKEVNNGNLK